MTQWVGARRPHMAMGTTSPDVVDISEPLSNYTSTKDTIIIIIISRWQGQQQLSC